MKISVIVCTHNPRPHYLQRVLDALKAQTLPKTEWEFLLVDNASKEPLVSVWDLSWHPNGRHIYEGELGLSHARLRGIKESRGDYLVFVDDDNLLEANYLETALSIFDQYPMLGAIGASIKGEFEIPPPDWYVPYLDKIAVCELDRNHWSNAYVWTLATPTGAGLCVRRQVAEDYTHKALNSPLRRQLDRVGTSLSSAGDTDMAYCAIDLGMGTGRFASLKLVHLISKGRLTKEYLIRLNAGMVLSDLILDFLRNGGRVPRPPNWRAIFYFLIEYFRAKGIRRSLFVADYKARNEARRILAASVSASK